MNPTLGAPIGTDIPEGRGLKVFRHVPKLHELLPNGGWPGVVYAQVCVHNLKAAADREERPDHLRPIRGSTYYSIVGPKGSADMALVGRGQPIPGGAPESGARLFFTDGEVAEQTGLEVGEYPIWFRQEAFHAEIEVASRADGAGEGQEGDARVQGRGAAQRQREEGHVAQASGGDRAVGGKKEKPNLSGHNHPANFGRIVAGCEGCDAVLARRLTKGGYPS